MSIKKQLEEFYGLNVISIVELNTLANYAMAITTPSGKYALKLYNPVSRTNDEVGWELELTNHLIKHDVPVAKPVTGVDGRQLYSFMVGGEQRPTVLFEWASGKKPTAGHETYVLLGSTAALIHDAAESFHSHLSREDYNAELLVDEQLQIMQAPLKKVARWQQAYALGERLKLRIADPSLDYGVCHMDLTLDNVHIDDGSMAVFDFDSAGTCWRAYEPYGVLLAAEERLQWWLEGYRSVREFSQEDERAVWAFAIIGDVRNTAWKLGVARSSRGKPLLEISGLASVVDEWLKWEEQHLSTK